MPALKADDFTRIVTLSAPDVVTAITFSPDGSILAVATGEKIHLYQVPPEARPNANAPKTSV